MKEYMTAKDIQELIPGIGYNAALKIINEIREKMKENNYFVPKRENKSGINLDDKKGIRIEMKELVKEKRILEEKKEEEKLLNAIHSQARWRNMEEENKRMMQNIDKELRKPTKKSKIKEVLQHELEIVLLMVVSAPGIAAWILLTFCLTH